MNSSISFKPRSATLNILNDHNDERIIRDVYLTIELRKIKSTTPDCKYVSRLAKKTHKYALWEDSFPISSSNNFLTIKCYEHGETPILLGTCELELENEHFNQIKTLNWMKFNNENGEIIGELFIEMEKSQIIPFKKVINSKPLIQLDKLLTRSNHKSGLVVNNHLIKNQKHNLTSRILTNNSELYSNLEGVY